MKKLFLTLVLVFATGTIMNANSNKNELLFGECTQAAWDWGTAMGSGNETAEYLQTDLYFSIMCNDDGTFNDFFYSLQQ